MQKGYRNIFFLLFSLSGFSGLIYESLWTHYLKLFLGHAAYAQSLVLAIFMGGLAIGSYVSSRYSPEWKNLLFSYALAEGAVGIFALVFHEVFSQALDISYSLVIPTLGSPATVEIYKWTLSSLIIFPQTVLLGMTFPLMSAGILRSFPENPGRSISLLYFTNSIGAVFGVLVSGFLLIRLMGLPWTMRFAGIINILVAVLVIVLSRHAATMPLAPERTAAGGPSPDRKWFAILLASSFVTGTASFMYEIGWIRMLSLVLGSSTHSFELMLGAFILGLSLGGLWIQRRIDGLSSPLRYLALVQITMGIFAISTLLIYGNTFEVMQWLMASLDRTAAGYRLFNLSGHAIALVIMLPATFCAGMTLPLITYILIRRGHGEKSIGAVYATNTVGAILGIFVAIHAGMPLLGLKGLLTLGAGLDIGLGLALMRGVSPAFSKKAGTAITVAGLLALLFPLLFVTLDPRKMSSGVYRDGTLPSPESISVLYHRDGKTATVSLTLRGGILSIRTNGKADAGIKIEPAGAASEDESTMVLLAALPLSIYPEARTIANIGLGSGLTSHVLLGSPLVERVDTIEIEAYMVEAAKRFGPFVERTFGDERSHIYIEDAKTFFSTHKRKYDIIVSEPSNPWVSGVSGLFSGEFYKLAGRHLTEKGLFVQWLQLYEIDLELVASIFKALSGSFDDYSVYAPDDHDLVIIATNGGEVKRPGQSIFRFPDLVPLLRRIGIESSQDIEIRRVGSKKILDSFFNSFHVRANSDYYPILDQNAARARFLGANAQELLRFTHEPLPILEMLDGPGQFRSDTRITISPFFLKTRWADTATSLRDYFLGRSGQSIGLTPEVENDARMMKRLFSVCGPFDGRENWTHGAYNVAVQMIPYLTDDETGRVWGVLAAGSCAPGHTEMEKEWIALFRAVGKRNAADISHYSRLLMDRGEALTEVEMKYLVAADMLASLVRGDGKRCRELSSGYRTALFKQEEPPVFFRLLAAQCSQGR